MTGDEETFKDNIALYEKAKNELDQEKMKLEKQIEDSKQFNPDLTDIKKACELVAHNLGNLTFEEKRLVIEALKIKVLVDRDNITIQSAIPVPIGATTPMVSFFHN